MRLDQQLTVASAHQASLPPGSRRAPPAATVRYFRHRFQLGHLRLSRQHLRHLNKYSNAMKSRVKCRSVYERISDTHFRQIFHGRQ